MDLLALALGAYAAMTTVIVVAQYRTIKDLLAVPRFGAHVPLYPTKSAEEGKLHPHPKIEGAYAVHPHDVKLRLVK